MFSKTFSTFSAWLSAQKTRTHYVDRITRLHQRYPAATLSQLRRHPNRDLKPLGQLRPRHGSRISASVLSAWDRRQQQKAFQVARLMRREGISFSAAVERVGGSRPTMLRFLGPSLKRRSGKLFIGKRDTLPRVMRMLDERGLYRITVRTSSDASKIGRYWATLSKWSQTRPRNDALLKRFERLSVTDEEGVKHRFLTDTKALERIFRAREVRFESVYAYAQS